MQIFAPRPSGASKKTSERSEVIVAFAFYIILEGICKKLPRRIERKRDSIEFERVKRSENQGQFFMIWLLIILKFLNSFRLPISLIFQ